MTLRGGGFGAGAALRISRDGRVVETITAAADGTFTTTIDSGPIASGVAESVSELTVSDADSTVVQHVRLTTFGASYAPKAASPGAKVRFSAFGFGPGRAVYVHYLRPNGRSADTVRLGPTRGACGTIRRTKARPLFPFTPRPGEWRLQFDTSRAVDPEAVPRVVVPVRVD
jgi:hypothetical protein